MKIDSIAPADKPSVFYLASLDGLRLFGFLLVFFVHLPLPAAVKRISEHGWIGVEIFFVAGVFLLFRLMHAEFAKDGRVNVGNFYLRRVLRIYPLLVTYYLFLLVFTGHSGDGMAWLRFVTTFLNIDNIVTWFIGFNYTVPAVGHLWTPSFEFQIYLVLPFLFFAWQKWGTKRFLWFLVALEVLAVIGRFYALEFTTHRTGVYVTPYFRPESVLLGMTLAVVTPRWRPIWSFLFAVVVFTAYFAVPPLPMFWMFFPAALIAAALVDSALRFPPVRAVLSTPPIRYLGKISFGLYVFHEAATWVVVKVIQRSGVDFLWSRWPIIIISLAFTIALAAVSYKYLELPFLRIKRRFTSVSGRDGDQDGVDDPPAASRSGVTPSSSP